MQRLCATAWLIWCNIFVFVKVLVQLIGMQHSTSMFISYRQYKLMTKVEVILAFISFKFTQPPENGVVENSQ